jgi:hypothetical protein
MKSDPLKLAYERIVVDNGNRRLGGSLKAIHNKGGDDLLQWLVDQTPEGSTIMEALAAIASDAMYEDSGE